MPVAASLLVPHRNGWFLRCAPWFFIRCDKYGKISLVGVHAVWQNNVETQVIRNNRWKTCSIFKKQKCFVYLTDYRQSIQCDTILQPFVQPFCSLPTARYCFGFAATAWRVASAHIFAEQLRFCVSCLIRHLLFGYEQLQKLVLGSNMNQVLRSNFLNQYHIYIYIQ